jgi:hypothetical protein
VRSVPLPDLIQLFIDAQLSGDVLKLDQLGKQISTADAAWVQTTDELVARMFRIPLEQWK